MPVGSESCCYNSDLLDPDENGPDPRHCYRTVPYHKSSISAALPTHAPGLVLCSLQLIVLTTVLLLLLAGLRIRSDPEIFHRIRILSALGQGKLYKQGKNILKIEVLHIFR